MSFIFQIQTELLTFIETDKVGDVILIPSIFPSDGVYNEGSVAPDSFRLLQTYVIEEPLGEDHS